MKAASASLTTPASTNKARTISLRVLRIGFGLMFLGAGGAKLAGVQHLVTEFDVVGLGQWFRYFTGVMEVCGAVLLLVPRTAFYGASVLTVVCIGALGAQLFVLHQDWIHAVVIGGLLAWAAWAERPASSAA